MDDQEFKDDEEPDVSDFDSDDPPNAVPVRIVKCTNPYDGTPAGNARLTFDAWIYGFLILFTIVGNILY